LRSEQETAHQGRNEFIPAVEKALKAQKKDGVLAHFPLWTSARRCMTAATTT
jgi:hypothetical protein